MKLTSEPKIRGKKPEMGAGGGEMGADGSDFL